MLTFYSAAGTGEIAVDLGGSTLPPATIWIDAKSPDDAERDYILRATGIEAPTRDELQAIEASSRLSVADGVLYLSATALVGVRQGDPHTTPLGLVLKHDLLVSVRFEELPALSSFVDHLKCPTRPAPCADAFLAGMLDAIVDRAADRLEQLGAELDSVSHRVFHAQAANSGGVAAPRPEEENLRQTLRQIGRAGDLTAKIREVLLGLGRIVPYIEAHAGPRIPPEVTPHFVSLRHDIHSLNDYGTSLTNQTQFLLDATLGLINIQQNNIIKVLTVVSVVGVPPTFLASMYGMNFKGIPEYDWSWGYPYALSMMLVSAVGPYLWFKFKGWL